MLVSCCARYLQHAEKDPFFSAVDDPAYFLAGLVNGGVSLLRDLVLVVLAVMLAFRGTVALSVGLVAGALELARIWFDHTSDHPTTASCLLSVTACAGNALAVFYVVFSSTPRPS